MNFKLKKFLVLMLATLAVMQNSWATGDSHFQTGVVNYKAGQFNLASQAFEDSLKENTAPGTLVNLGLAEWQQGNVGKAIMGWEQASWLNPLNRAARENLSYARETAQVNPPDLTWFEKSSIWLPANLWTWLAGVSLWLAVALITVPGVLRMRRAGWHQAVASLAFGFFLFSLAPCAGIITRSKIGILIEKNTKLRLTPTQQAEVVSALPEGEPVRALRRHGNYLFHSLPERQWLD